MKTTPLEKILLLLSVLLVCCHALPCCAAEASGRVVRVGWFDTGQTDRPEKSLGAHGYMYEYFQALSQYTGWTYEYVGGTWQECLDRLASGEIDLLGFVQKTKEREGAYGFPKQPMGVTSGWIVTGKSGKIAAADAESLEGATVGLVKGNAYNDDMRRYCQTLGCKVRYVQYDKLSAISPALEAGEIDVAVVADEDLTPSEVCLLRLAAENQYIVTGGGNPELLAKLDEAMVLIHTYSPYLNGDLHKKYFSTNRDGKPIFTSEEKAFIQSHPSILVLYDAGWPPVEYYDAVRKEYVGISPAIFRLLSEKCGIQFVCEGSTSGQVLTELKSKDVKNVLTTISHDYAWAEQHNVYITQPFLSSSIVRLGGNVDAPNPKVAINRNAYFTYLLENELNGVNTLHFSKQAERLEAVRTGQADYTFVTEDQANYYRSLPRYKDLDVRKLPGYTQKICISITRNSDSELIGILSKSLASITHDEMATLVMKNSVYSRDMTLEDVIYKYRVSAALIIFFALVAFAALASLAAYRHRALLKIRKSFELEKAALALAEKASAAKGSFMSRMSHEIRTPLNAVIGYNTIARNELAEAKTDAGRRKAEMKVMDCLTKSDIASKHLLTIINDVLDMAAIESGKVKIARERFDFKGLITSITTIFYSMAKAKGIEFEVVFDTLTEEWFVGDQMRVNQILTNLLSNAVKFTPEGGVVRLNIRQPEAELNASHIHFDITDTGIGMDPEYLSHIWTPFEQADASIARRFGGTGLGLSITRNLTSLMGGTITVQSEPGKGTTFGVDLTFERTEQPQHSAIYSFSTVNALVVDDDVSTCDYIKLLFARCGARCMSVTSGADALVAFAYAKANEDPFTLCLVDWRMPKMDGLETIRRIRHLAGTDVPIIVISAYDLSELVDKAGEAGISMFIAKPLFQSSLFDLLANICGKAPAGKCEAPLDCEFSGERVLLAEDNTMNMEIAVNILESGGLTVDSAWNGQEAVDLFEKSPAGTYQAILMDVQMPVVDGHEATRRIRSSSHPEAKTMPIIAMTADAFAENVSEALAAGMNDHIAKPIDIKLLLETLRKYFPAKG